MGDHSDDSRRMRARIDELERELDARRLDGDLRSALEHLYEGVQVIGFDWHYLYLNEAATRHGRRKPGELIGRHVLDAYPGMDGTEAYAAMKACMDERTPRRMQNEFTYPDGRSGWFDLRIEPVPIGIMVFSVDVSAQKVEEEQLRQSQKMEAIGRLAGGVAHDFNNLLTVINGYAALILDEIPNDATHRPEIEEIARAGATAAGLTRQLLAFSRKQALQPKVLDLNEVVTAMVGMLRRLIGENIEASMRLQPDIDPIEFDPGQIERILLNLAVNARDAMPSGGKLIIETANVHLDEAYVLAHRDAQTGPHVMIALTDTGVGMDAVTCARIFEPFFTTKGLGRGTGLGLSTVYGIVKQSGGNIWVYSEPGRGTTFKVYLPACPRTTAARPAAGAAPWRQASETVLVVEDDDSVRALLRRVLGSAGYTVIESGDPQEAIALSAAHEGEIHLLLTDVVMPGMTGADLARHIVAQRPRIVVVFSSGYTDNTIAHHGVLDDRAKFLEKPISPTTLLARLREFLDAR